MHLLNHAFYNFYKKNYKDLIDTAQELYHDGHKIINLSPHLIFPQGEFLNKEPTHFLDDIIKPDDSLLNPSLKIDPYHFLHAIKEKTSYSYHILFSLAELTLNAEDEILLLPGYDAKWNGLADKNKVIIRSPQLTDQKKFDLDDLRYLINSRTKWIVLDHGSYMYPNASPSFLKDLSQYLLDYPQIIVLDILHIDTLQKNICISKIEPRLTFRNIIFSPQSQTKESIYLPQRVFEFLYFFGFESLKINYNTVKNNIKKIQQSLPQNAFQISQSSHLLFIKKTNLKFYNQSSSFCEKEFLQRLLNELYILVDDGSLYGMPHHIVLGLGHNTLLFSKHLSTLIK